MCDGRVKIRLSPARADDAAVVDRGQSAQDERSIAVCCQTRLCCHELLGVGAGIFYSVSGRIGETP